MDIIIVDDNKNFRQTLESYLVVEHRHNVIEVFEDGNQLIDFFNSPEKRYPDIILIDIEMPNINGINTAKQILWRNRYLKMIAVTMYEDRAYLNELLAVGFKGCIFKSNIQEIDKVLNIVYNNQLYFPEDIQIAAY